ncbi:MAG: CDP-diacylglycerol--serine O-phosphatidyltransferase [Pseudomonadota bacterium]
MAQDNRRPDDQRPDQDQDDHDGVTIEVIERIVEGGRAVRQKGIYLLPNLVTTAALFFGFLAILAAMAQKWEHAAVYVFIAGVLDGLDGRIARMTNTQSEFGAQYDSLSDAVAFGLAPGIVMFAWALNGLGKAGYAIAFIYAACAALRLARFNVQIETSDKRYFTGLPSPAAAATVAGMVWVLNDYGVAVDRPLAILAAVVTAAAAVLMVSNVRYYSFKDLQSARVPLFALIIAIGLVAVVQVDPPTMLWGAALLYAASGPVGALWRRLVSGRSASGHS